MVKQWVQPPSNKNRLPPGVFFFWFHLTSFIFTFILKVFIGMLGESFEIQCLALFYIDFNRGFNQIWNQFLIFTIRVFHWTIRGTLKTRDVAIFFPTCSHHLPIFLHHFPIFCPCDLGISERHASQGAKKTAMATGRTWPLGRWSTEFQVGWWDNSMMTWIIQYSYIYIYIYWLVVSTPSEQYESQLGWLFPYIIWKIETCSKPPTR